MENLLIHCGIIAAYCMTMLCVIFMRRMFRKHPGVQLPVIILLILFLPAVAFASGSDHTGENWLLLIGIMLCWLKG